MVLHNDLDTLSDTCRKFAPLLNALECIDRSRPTQKRPSENICGSHGILYCQIDSNAADRGHGVRGIANANETRPVPSPQPVHLDGQELDLPPIVDLMKAVAKERRDIPDALAEF